MLMSWKHVYPFIRVWGGRSGTRSGQNQCLFTERFMSFIRSERITGRLQTGVNSPYPSWLNCSRKIHDSGVTQKCSPHPSNHEVLCTHADDLTWSNNTSCLIRKAHQRLSFFRRLRSSVLISFYRCVVESLWCLFLLHHCVVWQRRRLCRKWWRLHRGLWEAVYSPTSTHLHH